MTDEELAAAFLQGEGSKAFEVLYSRYERKVYYKCMSILKSKEDAHDACHDIFVKLYFKLGDFDGRSSLSTWLFSITYRYCIDQLRKVRKWRWEDDKDLEEEAFGDGLEELEILALKVGDLHWVLDHLPPEETAILLMKYQDQMPIAAIASELGIGESAVKMRLKRSRDHAGLVLRKRVNKRIQ